MKQCYRDKRNVVHRHYFSDSLVLTHHSTKRGCGFELRLTVQRTKLCRSGWPANDATRRYNTPRPFLLLSRVPLLRHCDAFATNFTAAEFRASCRTLLRVVVSHVRIGISNENPREGPKKFGQESTGASDIQNPSVRTTARAASRAEEKGATLRMRHYGSCTSEHRKYILPSM
ncbi:hypothetical protein EVAR_79198_1 [Eumeta japonica]|uniref:Uncharacterized protein n=1 Tax=Eumeta variegata TaxID=151549 RepID=A0A4C1UTM1_EUMVA|nr:hypothetical protein EVAR_79198_1 [Eumeta japonica]